VKTSLAAMALLSLAVTAQEPLPRFRAGANLVSVDAYVSKDGKPVTNLKRDEIEIFEDDRPQQVGCAHLSTAASAEVDAITSAFDVRTI
jgi:hypothetical protein